MPRSGCGRQAVALCWVVIEVFIIFELNCLFLIRLLSKVAGKGNAAEISVFYSGRHDTVTRCRPSKGRRCIPDVDIEVHVENYLNVDLSSSAQVKIQVSNSISNFFEEKNQIFGFPWCSTREDLFIDVSITNVGLRLTKLRWFQLFVNSQNSNFEHFWK